MAWTQPFFPVTGLKQYVDFIVTSENAKSSKPQEKIFDYAARKAGGILLKRYFVSLGKSYLKLLQGYSSSQKFSSLHWKRKKIYSEPCHLSVEEVWFKLRSSSWSPDLVLILSCLLTTGVSSATLEEWAWSVASQSDSSCGRWFGQGKLYYFCCF